jgi:hypothetical protein
LAEYARCRRVLLDQLGREHEMITLTVDGWGNPLMQSLYGYMVVLADRTSHLLALQDHSDMQHDAVNLAGKVLHGAQYVLTAAGHSAWPWHV